MTPVSISIRLLAVGSIFAAAFWSAGASAAGVPKSARAAQAMNRAVPRIKTQLEQAHLRFGAPIFIRIFKHEKQLEVWLQDTGGFRLFKTYPICAYSGALGPKLAEGDGQAPEGFYFVRPNQFNPLSKFHLSFNLGYPNAYDRAHGRTGSYLMVHGQCVSIGCFAMAKRPAPVGTDRNDPIEEIWSMADAAYRQGQSFFRVHIFPFRMTEENLKSHEHSQWADFWRNLSEGYRYFEQNLRPPNVTVRSKRYVFSAP